MPSTAPRTLHAARSGDGYVVEADPAEDGVVKFVAQGGGFVVGMPVADFDRQFRAMTPEECDARLRYEKGAVTGDWIAEDGKDPIPAWLNDKAWNGWRMPVFEREDILKAIGDGRLAGLRHISEFDVFVALDAMGEEIPEIDDGTLLAKLKEVWSSGPTQVEIEIGGKGCYADIYVREEIALRDGAKAYGYPVGAGYWCWEAAPAPEDEIAPPRP